MIDGKNFFDQPAKSDLKIFDNIWKTATGQGDDYVNGCLLDYLYYFRIHILHFSQGIVRVIWF